MSEPSPHHPSVPLTFSAGGSPVRICPSQASRPAWRVIDPACFTRWRGSFARYDPGSGLWRTSQISLISGFQVYSQKWPRAGIMRAGECSEHQRWARPTVESGGSVSRGWPTMTASEGQRGHGWQRANGRIYPTLTGATGAARAGPTQRASDPHRSGKSATAAKTTGAIDISSTPTTAPVYPSNISKSSIHTHQAAWPTPSATDHKGSSQPGQRRGQLTEPLEPGSGGRLNPSWVEALQGFPPGWTAPTDGLPLQDHSTLGNRHAPDHDSPTTGSD
jgi:hypothetical protein